MELHSHSSVSDGVLDPLDLLRLAKRRGCLGVAITDHDTLEGSLRALKASRLLGLGVTVIVGVEVRTTWGDVLVLCPHVPAGEPPRDPIRNKS